MLRWLAASGAPNGIRTRAAALKGRCPRPLDDGGSTTLAAGTRGARRRGPPQHRGRTTLAAKRPTHASILDGRGRQATACRPRRTSGFAALVDQVLGDRRLLAFLG